MQALLSYALCMSRILSVILTSRNMFVVVQVWMAMVNCEGSELCSCCMTVTMRVTIVVFSRFVFISMMVVVLDVILLIMRMTLRPVVVSCVVLVCCDGGVGE